MQTNPLRPASLAGLADGQICYVNTIELTGLFRRRVFDLGIVPGTRVECVLRSPSGNPIAYCVRGAVIALRSEDAARIKVKMA